MKHVLLILLLTIYACCTSAQNKKIDSLNKALATATADTTRINLLIAKANAYTENNLDSAVSIAETAIAKAKSIHFTGGEARGYRAAITALNYKGAFSAALQYLKASEQLYKQTGDSQEAQYINSAYGMYYGMQSKYDSSVLYYRKAIDYLEKNGPPKQLAKMYQNIAVSYTMQSNYTPALTYQTKARQLAESLHDTSGLAYINLNMAFNYSALHDYEQAENLMQKAVLYAQHAQIKNVELYAYTNLAAIYNQLGRYAQSYAYAMKAATLGKQLGDNPIIASSLARAAVALAFQKQYTQAEQLGMQAIAIADTIDAPMNKFQVLTNMGSIKQLQQQLIPAITYYEKGFATLKDADLYDEQIADAYSSTAKLYEQAGKYEKALAAFKIATKITDSLRSRENVRKATELSMSYDFAKKEQATKAEQDRRNAIADARQLALLIGLGLTILLVLVAVYAYINKQKTNIALQQQKSKLEQTLTELKATQNQLIQSEKMASLGELTAGIAHEIQNPLNFVNNFSEVNEELLEEMETAIAAGDILTAKSLSEDIKQNLQKVVHHGKRADSIVKSMLQHSNKSSGNKEAVDINKLADEYLRLSYHGMRAKDKGFSAALQTNFDDHTGKINIIRQDIGRVLLNLYTNAFYAIQQKQKRLNGTGYEPTITVSTNKLDNTVEIKIRDNGEGIPEAIATKIFQPFFTTKPTGEGTGLGLSLSYDIITKLHGGSLCIHSQEGEYAEFVINLPA